MDIEISYFRMAVKGIVFAVAVWFLIANMVAKYKRVTIDRKGWDELVAVVIRSFVVLVLVILILYFF